MQCSDLTPEQASHIRDQVRLMLRYLRRIIQRMNKRRFPVDDPRLRTALVAYDAIMRCTSSYTT
jgi:hypothetical protein